MSDGRILEFHDVCGRRLGRHARVLAITGSLLTLLGGMLVYWILLTNFLFHIGNFVHDRVFDVTVASSNGSYRYDNAVCRSQNVSGLCATNRNDNSTNGGRDFQHWWSETRTIPLYLLLLLFPLLNFKSPTIFTRMNSVGMLSLVYLVVFVAVKAAGWGVNIEFKAAPEGSHAYDSHIAAQFRPTFPALTGVAALGYFVQNSVLSLVRNQKHPQHNVRCVRDLILAYILVLVTYVYFGGLFYITFPLNKNCITDNVLDTIASSDVLCLVARVGLFFQLTCLFPQLAFITRIQLYTALYGNPWPSFVGALCGFYYAIGLPCLVRCVSLKEEGRLTYFHIVFHGLLVLIGLANFVAQFFVLKDL
ncbi:neutral amino acid transporter 9-like [Littorina saxatilis]|uniref:neutral amino acid transporter 9-like n=1 Tax=Littorina saxatilis TaxID=31220 RepID=UPI0038B5F9B4